jgi:rubrerythrin
MKELATRSIVGSETERLLANAYAGESMAYSRYTFFAQIAEKEGYFEFAEILNRTASNELHHAKVYFKFLKEENSHTAPLEVDAGKLGTTLENLKVAAQEEEMEGVEKYIRSAEVAEREGFPEIAERFRSIAEVEKHHKARFERMIRSIEDGTVWKSEKSEKWLCLVCGYVHEGEEPPANCPACAHPREHFAKMACECTEDCNCCGEK